MVYDMIYQNVEYPLFYQDQHQLDHTYYLVMMPSMENGPGRHCFLEVHLLSVEPY